MMSPPPCDLPTSEASPSDSDLTIIVAGINVSTSASSKTAKLAPPESNSDPSDTKASNHNRFYALIPSDPNTSNSKQRKWVVPPKSEQQLRDAKAARDKRIEIAKQKKLQRSPPPLPVDTESELKPDIEDTPQSLETVVEAALAMPSLDDNETISGAVTESNTNVPQKDGAKEQIRGDECALNPSLSLSPLVLPLMIQQDRMETGRRVTPESISRPGRRKCCPKITGHSGKIIE